MIAETEGIALNICMLIYLVAGGIVMAASRGPGPIGMKYYISSTICDLSIAIHGSAV